MRRYLFSAAIAAMAVAGVAHASGNIVTVNEGAFTAQAGKITFSEFAQGTQNPTYNPSDYGGGVGAPIVTFGGYFTGQSLGTAGTCPPGAGLGGCVVGTPTAGLTLDPNSPKTFITGDGAQAHPPILSGGPNIFNGPIAIRFSTLQAGVGLVGGYFDAVGSTAITAYGLDGHVIGEVANTQTGVEFLGLVTADKSATIAGLLFHLVGDEPAGFDVDDIRFGTADQVVIPPTTGVPEPMTWALMMMGFGGMGAALRRRRHLAAVPA